MKSFNLILCVATFILAQNPENNNIKDYFLPSDGNNKSVYYMPDPKTGDKTGVSTTNWFIKEIDGSYQVIRASFFKSSTMSIITEFINITNNEIKVFKTASTTMFETNRKKTYYPARVYLKMPKGNIKSVWEYTRTTEETDICTSEWITVNIDGQTKKAIKVKRQLKGQPDLFTTELYVKGIGLWKISVSNGNILKILDYQEYDPEVSEFNRR